MILKDLHTHTTWCDGKNTPEEMVQAAIALGMETLGFSGHSYVPFDDCCMTPAGTELYRQEIAGLKQQYSGRLEILCGVEQDYYSPAATDGYDYVIGSVHYLRLGDSYPPIDLDAQTLRQTADCFFDGDVYALAECYYDTAADVVNRTGCDIIGHFDLVTKFNERDPMFDLQHPRYLAAWRAALDRLLKTGAAFEINTGAMSRGYRTAPYPAMDMIDYIRSHGGRLLLSSDSHSRETLLYHFEDYAHLL